MLLFLPQLSQAGPKGPTGYGRSDGVAPEAGKGPLGSLLLREATCCVMKTLRQPFGEVTWGGPEAQTSQRSPGMVGRQWGAYPALISHLLRTGGPCSWAFVKGQGLTFQGSINDWRTIAYDLMACRLPTAAPLGSQPWSPQGEGETRTPGWAAVVTSSASLSPRGTCCMFTEGCPRRHSSHLPCCPPVEGTQCPLHPHMRSLVLI